MPFDGSLQLTLPAKVLRLPRRVEGRLFQILEFRSLAAAFFVTQLFRKIHLISSDFENHFRSFQDTVYAYTV